MFWNEFTFGKSRGFTWRRLEEGDGSPRYVLVAPNGAITHYDVVYRGLYWVARAGKSILGECHSLDAALRVVEEDAR